MQNRCIVLSKKFYNLKLNIMKKAIAMKCNQERFDAVKPKLKDFEITSIDPFETYEYLVNNGGNQNNLITNITYEGRSTYAREVHETWNEKIFLEACGIEVEEPKEESFVIAKELLLQIHSESKLMIKGVIELSFPSAFEPEKKELVVGKWYTNNQGALFHCSGVNESGNPLGYGFSHAGVFVEDTYNPNETWSVDGFTEVEYSKVEEALKAEAVRRGFVEGCYFVEPINQPIYDSRKRKAKGSIGFFGDKLTELHFTDTESLIFREGVWGTVIPVKKMTKAEAEIMYNIEIV